MFSGELAEKLSPYTGLTGKQAQQFLDYHPLDIKLSECDEINEQCHMQAELRLLSLWKKSLASIAFKDLSCACKTVIASVAFQYGDLSKQTPIFGLQVTEKDWQAAVSILRNFGDKYAIRRNKEVELLAHWLSGYQKVNNE